MEMEDGRLVAMIACGVAVGHFMACIVLEALDKLVLLLRYLNRRVAGDAHDTACRKIGRYREEGLQ